ncbi:MAG TPA: hypothetical protein VF765_22645 [Polyangiaceae bacterium]
MARSPATTTRTMVVGAIAAGILAAAPSVARAQEMSMGPPREPLVITPRVGIETGWTRFDLNGSRGDAYGVTARLDVRASRIVGLRLLLPVYALDLDGRSTQVGLGDAELRVRILVLDDHDWRMYVGLSDQLPTGNNGIGLGQGGTQLSPFVTAGWRNGGLVLYGTLADVVALHSQGNPPAFDYVDPSSDHEARYSLGAIFDAFGPVYANAALTGVTVLTPTDAGSTFVYGGVAIGLLLGEYWKLVASAQLPIAGEHRFESKVGLNLYFYF